VLFSGIAGFWSDRTSKRSIIVWCKVLEIVVMAAGAVAFYFLPASRIPWGPLAALFFMGAQSALFGPSKYGILPEMVRASDLPRFNGIIQMTTFIALILGIPLAGALKHQLGNDRLWIAGFVCVGIAVVGTLTSLGVRRTPVADRGARFTWSAMAVSHETWRMLRQSRAIGFALLVYSLFWFVAAIVPMATNATGIRQMGLNDESTSMMLACVAVGIAVGCPLAGWLSRGRVNFALVRIGAWGICACLGLMAAAPLIPRPNLAYLACQLVLGAAGIFVGLLAVPLQVFLQTSPPDEQEGRTIGTMNLINWVGIIASGGYYFVCDRLAAAMGWPPSSIFAMTAVLLVPVAVLYRPRNK
jgi:acyl-[acyl-carrier-protein]-phospholipid O-acyltransferase/long-chain-fatty-acid--[acyl-carrier-protein] ligase